MSARIDLNLRYGRGNRPVFVRRLSAGPRALRVFESDRYTGIRVGAQTPSR